MTTNLPIPEIPENAGGRPVTFQDIEASGLIAKERAGVLALTGLLRPEMALILPDGETTIYSHINGLNETAIMRGGLEYIGTMRKKEEGWGRQFEEIPPDWIKETDKLVLLNTEGTRTVSKAVTRKQTRWSGFQPLFY